MYSHPVFDVRAYMHADFIEFHLLKLPLLKYWGRARLVSKSAHAVLVQQNSDNSSSIYSYFIQKTQCTMTANNTLVNFHIAGRRTFCTIQLQIKGAFSFDDWFYGRTLDLSYKQHTQRNNRGCSITGKGRDLLMLQWRSGKIPKGKYSSTGRAMFVDPVSDPCISHWSVVRAVVRSCE